ncbi:MAG: hypothetical protein C4531_15945 [Desulfurivibrio sp.]|jgi:hypothetical protein|nr:MAG: hypothetical protein C4531_15945 [Desulfurivibrio sp.]
MADILTPVVDFINYTKLLEQIRQVDVKGLFTNPWFLVPFIAQIGWWFYKQALNSLVCTGLALGVWGFSGTSYAQQLVIDGELQLSKVLPVAGVGMVVIVLLVYLFFIRSD